MLHVFRIVPIWKTKRECLITVIDENSQAVKNVFVYQHNIQYNPRHTVSSDNRMEAERRKEYYVEIKKVLQSSVTNRT